MERPHCGLPVLKGSLSTGGSVTFFAWPDNERTRKNGFKLKKGKFILHVGRRFLVRGWLGTGTCC